MQTPETCRGCLAKAKTSKESGRSSNGPANSVPVWHRVGKKPRNDPNRGRREAQKAVNSIAAASLICVVQSVRRGSVHHCGDRASSHGNREQRSCRFGWHWQNWRPAQQVGQCWAAAQCTFRKRRRRPSCITSSRSRSSRSRFGISHLARSTACAAWSRPRSRVRARPRSRWPMRPCPIWHQRRRSRWAAEAAAGCPW